MARSIPVKELRADAAVLESVVLHHRYATREDLAPHRPGGPENPDKGAHGWLRFMYQLHRLHARGVGGAAAVSTPFTVATEQEQLALLRGAPVAVELVGRAPDGAPTHLHVHPKSLATLTDCCQRDLVCGWLAMHYHAREGDTTAAALAFRTQMLDEMLYQQRVLVWIVTSPGPRLPFSDTTTRPQPPQELADLDALDVYRILQAHQLVNHLRLKSLTDLMLTNPGDPGAVRPSWAVFMGAVANEMGVRTDVLLNEWSLGEVIAQHAMAAKARQDAEAALATQRERAG